MTQLYQRNMARHVLLARQAGDGLDRLSLSSSPTTTDSSTSSTPSSTPLAPSPSSSPTESKPSSTSDPVKSTTSLAVTSTDSTSTSTSALTSTSKAASTTTSTSTTSPSTSTVPFTTSVPQPTTAFSATVNNDPLTFAFTSPISEVPSTTISAVSTASPSSGLSAGSIVGAVAGTLIGLALLGFLITFILRRYRQSRRRTLRDSDFGTSFRRSAFITPRSTMTPDMAETDHNVAPSLKEPYIPYPTATVQPPSQALATATAATAAPTTTVTTGVLQERPKYVYGQDPKHPDDVASDVADGGAYSSQPQVQSTYNAEAYGNYAKYEDVGNGIVGGVPGGAGMYQDAERAYQGQQGYDQGHHGTYPSHYAAYDPSQYAGYAQQQQHHRAYAGTDAYGGI